MIKIRALKLPNGFYKSQILRNHIVIWTSTIGSREREDMLLLGKRKAERMMGLVK